MKDFENTKQNFADRRDRFSFSIIAGMILLIIALGIYVAAFKDNDTDQIAYIKPEANRLRGPVSLCIAKAADIGQDAKHVTLLCGNPIGVHTTKTSHSISEQLIFEKSPSGEILAAVVSENGKITQIEYSLSSEETKLLNGIQASDPMDYRLKPTDSSHSLSKLQPAP